MTDCEGVKAFRRVKPATALIGTEGARTLVLTLYLVLTAFENVDFVTGPLALG